jgi:2-methylcitrate dehydratase PrpD
MSGPETTGLAGQIGDFAAGVRERGLPPELRHEAARRVLDLMGNSLLAHTQPVAASVLAVVRGWGGRGPATAIGSGDRLPAPSAALVNGTLAHAMDFDDSHLLSVLHPSASVIPAALAAAQAQEAGGHDLLDAITVGTEITIRLGLAGYDPESGNSIFFERGQHATSICGTVGAAVASAMLLGAGPAHIASTIGIAASMGSGLLEANRTGGTIKRLHCGWAAHAGTAAAQLAQAGITGPPTVLEGRFGFLQAWCGDCANPSAITDGLGKRWETSQIVLKPYPCNHFTHPAIDAALQLRAQGLHPDDVSDITLGAPTAALRTIGEPVAIKASPATGYAAAFSGPYAVAAALLGGGGLGVWLDDFTDEAAADPARRALAAKVHCVPDPECDAIFPRAMPAVLTARTYSGEEFHARITSSRGGPEQPLTDTDLATKYTLAAVSSVDMETANRLHEAIIALPDGGRITDIFPAPGGDQ